MKDLTTEENIVISWSLAISKMIHLALAKFVQVFIIDQLNRLSGKRRHRK